MRGMTKRKRVKPDANASNFNKSISTYGKTQMRLINEIPCSNWLPCDDFLCKEKDSLDITHSSDNDQLFSAFGRTARVNIFNSDSEDEDFQVGIKKQKTLQGRNKHPGRKKLKQEKDTKQTTSKKDAKKKSKAGKRRQDATTEPKLKADIENVSPCNPSDSGSALPDDCHPQIRSSSAIHNFAAAEKEVHPILQKHPLADEKKCKSILRKNSLVECNGFDCLQDTSCTSKYRVSFNSTVIYHATNIMMNSPKSSACPDKSQIQTSRPVLAQSTPLTAQKSNLVERIGHPLGNIVTRLQEAKFSAHNEGKSQLQTDRPIISKSSPLAFHKSNSVAQRGRLQGDINTTPQEERRKPAAIQCAQSTKNTTASKKLDLKKAHPGKKMKKPARWKKKGGMSFTSSRKMQRSKVQNNSILHQIMLGAAIDPKYDFFEDSTDVYFVNSCSSHSRIKIANSPSLTNENLRETVKEQEKRPEEGVRNSCSKTSNPCYTQDDGHVKEPIMNEGLITSKENEEKSAEASQEYEVGACENKVLAKTNGRLKRNLRTKRPVNYKLMHSGFAVSRVQMPHKAVEDGGKRDFEDKMPPIKMPLTQDGSAPFSSLSFSSNSTSASLNSQLNRESDTEDENDKRKHLQGSPVLRPPARNLRTRKVVNYKELSNGDLQQGQQSRMETLCTDTVTSTSDNSKFSYAGNASEKTALSPDMFEVHRVTPNQEDISHEDRSKLASEFREVLNDFVADRNRRKCKTIPRVASRESSLFSTLSFNLDKNRSKIDMQMHGFSTINHGNSDEERHGNVLSDDEHVNSNIAAAKRISTPIAVRSPTRPVQTLYSTPCDQVIEFSERVAKCKSRLGNFSPIPTLFKDSLPPCTMSATRVKAPSCSDRSQVLHLKQRLLEDKRTTSPLQVKFKSGCKCHAWKKMPPRRCTRSPGSHLSSSVIKVDRSISEKRRRTLDPVRVDLSSAILYSEKGSNISRTPISQSGRKSHSDVEVLVTPLNKRFFELLSTRGDRIRLKSLGIVDALTPKRLTSGDGRVLTSREKVLYECEQLSPKSFEEAMDGIIPETCFKLGEGLYGEVFRCDFACGPDAIAIKVIPIEGTVIVNGEKQKTFVEVLPEIISSKELHNLRHDEENSTHGFIELHRVNCVKGKYPPFLLNAWDAYNEERYSDNDRPDMFPEEQLYLVFQYADGGTDVEHFKFRSAAQAFSVLQQISASLAVAERSLEFEHRDLHWGNVLVSRTSEKVITGKLHGKEFKMATHGVRASVIDFTLSRLSKEGVTVFQDLAADADLFEMNSAEDYQFEIYRLMKVATKNNWSMFQPKNNVYWIHYLCDKFRKEVKFSHRKSGFHRSYLSKLNDLDKNILTFNSCFNIMKANCLLSPKGIS